MFTSKLLSLSIATFLYVGCSLAHNCYNANVPTVLNGYISSGSSYDGATRIIICNSGYQRSQASQYVTCRNSQWTLPLAQCIRIGGNTWGSATSTSHHTSIVWGGVPGSVPARPPVRNGEFQCDNGVCISMSLKCNSINECGDWSDERGCQTPTPTCAFNEFTCRSGRCIPTSWACDGRNDCGDWSDEECQRPQAQTCNSHQFTCANSNCIWDAWKCDGENDCGDWSDERNCPTGGPRFCPSNQFSCNNGACIPSSWRCNGSNDCGDFSDEQFCLTRS